MAHTPAHPAIPHQCLCCTHTHTCQWIALLSHKNVGFNHLNTTKQDIFILIFMRVEISEPPMFISENKGLGHLPLREGDTPITHHAYGKFIVDSQPPAAPEPLCLQFLLLYQWECIHLQLKKTQLELIETKKRIYNFLSMKNAEIWQISSETQSSHSALSPSTYFFFSVLPSVMSPHHKDGSYCGAKMISIISLPTFVLFQI